jgi:hypothetical protein
MLGVKNIRVEDVGQCRNYVLDRTKLLNGYLPGWVDFLAYVQTISTGVWATGTIGLLKERKFADGHSCFPRCTSWITLAHDVNRICLTFQSNFSVKNRS